MASGDERASAARAELAGATYLEPLTCYLRACGVALPADLAALRASALSWHRFKRSASLPRVQRVLGTLRGLQPATLLDIGSGRGAFLWPLLDAFPSLSVLAGELSPRRVELLTRVRQGGLSQLKPLALDVRALPLVNEAVDVACCLEVLEHLPDADPLLATRELCRVARRFVVVSVPSRPDDNPQHLQLFAAEELEALLIDAGARRTQASYVHNHLIVVATLDNA
jgi:2-polyprenyl-3-methyl-5-hydroxy-6-metoxy-1,4-benzoquinol methylase